MAAESPKFMFIQPIPKSTWDALGEMERKAFIQGVANAMVHVSWEVKEEAKIDGMRLFPEDEEGNPLPEMVVIAGTIELRA